MSKISAIILTYNNEQIIAKCLDSIGWADEIIVVDSFSSDNTLAICRNYTDRIYQKEYEKYARTRNFSLSLASFDWILIADSDEVYTPALAKEIKEELSSNEGIAGYYIPLRHVAFGKELLWWRRGELKLRLFRKESGIWQEREAHPKLIINGRTKTLKNNLLHYPYPDLKTLWEKYNRYTTWDAIQLAKEKKCVPLAELIRALFSPLPYFIRMYIMQGVYKDAAAGLLLSISCAIYRPLVYFKFIFRKC